ncbi:MULTISPECIES: 2OG-Fe(II) oxygenase family protein [unclassified Caballeronia]|uniref:2OG-Fe(II) oxygenase family protein n=1 Tax=unclassified Caballeronia TaxID=2646786 RepID=UPI00285A826B|nr:MULTISPECIES: 2OG-Fe(II) oxygenase family protein [unclassified Caballeronia]MDR5777258.1 2OG-Fe(II) oxygenase family protein [Caballeronia sp. LZ002]MDR5798892.1 2OG-Fe(II) oxygenase family protein [Caballeronia sp. LZ001]MDR5852696.1 2OG-Fe(II) oxygenase family protein [Caballeronia sp. LZ003]
MTFFSSYLDNSVVCVDNVLEQPDFSLLVKQLEAPQSISPSIERTYGIWTKNTYNNPSQSRVIIWVGPHNKPSSPFSGIELYPTDTRIDHVIDAARDIAVRTGIAGTFNKDWIAIMASRFDYGAAGGLMFHTDEVHYACAFSMYFHSEWKADWGGHFLFSQQDITRLEQGVFLTPLPNRMVLVRAGVPHSISGVSAQASRPRQAITGFFVRPEHAFKLLEKHGDPANSAGHL